MPRLDVITVFPELFAFRKNASRTAAATYLERSIVRRAIQKRLVEVQAWDLRSFAADRRRTVDDSPYGGGAGMVLKVDPIYRAVKTILGRATAKKRTRVVLFSTRGKKFDARAARRLSKYGRVVLICGRYEGVDERVARYVADEEISVGDFVLSGGELPAFILIDAIARQIPGVLGKRESLEEIKGSYPVYTRPAMFSPDKKKKWPVPEVFLSGHHDQIDAARGKRR